MLCHIPGATFLHNTIVMTHTTGTFVKGTSRRWNLETTFLGILGIALIYIALAIDPHLSVIEETIVLVVFLGALLGVAPIPFPNLKNRTWLYPIIAGLLSAFMDSFLVLLMVAAIPIQGKKKDILAFKAYAMMAALIGGLLIYFGEVYALPHYLKYGLHHIYDALPLFVPVLIFLGVLGYLVQRLAITITPHETTLEEGLEKAYGEEHLDEANAKRGWENIVEFVIGVGIILFTHNVLLALGILFTYAFASGQGEDLLHVIKTETEVGVMLLLFTAWVIFEPVQPLLQLFTGFHALWPSMINAVFSGALLPAGGNVWREISVISAGALFLPISSLVGVMLFKTLKEWWAYLKLSIPMMLLWLILSLGWFTYIWPHAEPMFFHLFNIGGYHVVTESEE